MTNLTEKACIACLEPLKDGEKLKFCSACGTGYHLACWDGLGECAVAECDYKKEAKEQECPYCKETILAGAIICKHCKSDLRIPVDEKEQGASSAYLDQPVTPESTLDLLKELCSRTFKSFMQHPILLTVIAPILGIVNGVLYGIVVLWLEANYHRYYYYYYRGQMPPAFFLTIGVLIFANMWLLSGFYKTFLKAAKGERVSFGQFFSGGHSFRLLATLFLISLGTGLLGLLLIVPGLIFAALSLLAPIIVADGELGAFASLKKSMALVKENWQISLLAYFVIFLFNLLGALPYGLGLLITLPFTALILSHLYLELNED